MLSIFRLECDGLTCVESRIARTSHVGVVRKYKEKLYFALKGQNNVARGKRQRRPGWLKAANRFYPEGVTQKI